MTDLWLVRHGQTDWNVEGKWQGQTPDAPGLNDMGCAQAIAVGEQLKGTRFAAIYCSDLLRALQTAELIAVPLGLNSIVEPRLREMNLGLWEGMLSSEIATQYPNELAERARDPLHARPPQGESPLEAAKRVIAAVTGIVDKYPDESVLIVSHGIPLAVIICHAQGISMGQVYEHVPENAKSHRAQWKSNRIMLDPKERIRTHIEFIYGKSQASEIFPLLWARLEAFLRQHPNLQKAPPPQARLTEQDIFLITYGDQFREPGRPPLQLLYDFLGTHLADELSGVHLLPFYPYSSDDGFSVIDYFQVNPDFGSWADVERLGERFRLMFDAVINHISSQSAWFQGFLRGEGPYRDYFLTTDPRADLSQVTRPRTAPLLTSVETKNGLRHVWTTFSTDQIDLNFANPNVLLEVIDSLLCYVAHGAQVIRLDAIAYLWKEIGTTCIHLPQTHRVVKLFRALLDVVAPGVLLITETNVPHQENVSYFGVLLPDGQSTDEAQMVYQFPLAPLTLHTFLTGDATRLTNWVAGLSTPAPGSAFFNFTASHDGIGVRPAEGLLSPEEIQALAAQTLAHGGHVSYKSDPDGSQSAYELNNTWFDALNDPSAPDPEMDVARFLASQAIMLALAGVPGVYVHSLFGSRNCPSCVAETGRTRSINRQKFHLDDLLSELHMEGSHTARVFSGYRHLLQARRMHPAFHPAAGQRVISLSPAVFSLLRTSSTQSQYVLCLTNVTAQPQQFEIDLTMHGLPLSPSWKELLSSKDEFITGGRILGCSLDAYQTRWLMPAAA